MSDEASRRVVIEIWGLILLARDSDGDTGVAQKMTVVFPKAGGMMNMPDSPTQDRKSTRLNSSHSS